MRRASLSSLGKISFFRDVHFLLLDTLYTNVNLVYSVLLRISPCMFINLMHTSTSGDISALFLISRVFFEFVEPFLQSSCPQRLEVNIDL